MSQRIQHIKTLYNLDEHLWCIHDVRCDCKCWLLCIMMQMFFWWKMHVHVNDMPIGMCSKDSLMDLFNDMSGLGCIHVSKQDLIFSFLYSISPSRRNPVASLFRILLSFSKPYSEYYWSLMYCRISWYHGLPSIFSSIYAQWAGVLSILCRLTEHDHLNGFET